VLLNKCDVLSQPVDVQLREWYMIQEDVARSRLVEPNQQLAECALARATLANDECRFSCWKEDCCVSQSNLVRSRRIREGDLIHQHGM
jgi:hypothetical protein